ncbi:MAG: ComEC/Rec2 family competence protein [Bacteroidales bacterium]|nr:ComEC/Rec2 family competence protein [Bacteroidales bacterium]
MNIYTGLRKIPFVRLLLFFIPGIVTAYWLGPFDAGYTYKLTWAVFVLVVLFLFLVFFKKTEKFTGFLIALLLFSIAFVYTASVQPSKEIFYGKNFYQAVIYNSPQPKEKNLLLPVVLHLPAAKGKFCQYKANLYVKYDENVPKNFSVGDKILVKGAPERIKNCGNPNEFNYKLYMASKGVFYQLWANKDDISIITAGNKAFSINKLVFVLREKIREQLGSFIGDSESLALITAVSIGDRNLITGDMRDSYARAGVMHILAVSGLHIGILFMFLNFLLMPMERFSHGRTIKVVFIVLVIWFYALLSGMSASVNRAAIMFSLISLGQLFRRHISYFNILAASALFMLAFNPLQLYDAGFQLSYLAVGGIVFYQPKFNRLFSFSNKIAAYFYQLLCVSLAAQLTTLPLVIYYFNQFPVYFWLANLFVIPIMFVLLVFIVIFFVFSFSPLLSIVMGKLCSVAAFMLNTSVGFTESLPFSVLSNLYLTRAGVFVLYILLIAATLWFTGKKYAYLKTSLLLVNVFLVLCILDVYTLKQKQCVTIYNTSGCSTLGIYSGRQAYLFSTACTKTDKEKALLSCSGHLGRIRNTKEIKLLPFDTIASVFGGGLPLKNKPNMFLKLNRTTGIIVYQEHGSILSGTAITNATCLFVPGNVLPPKQLFETGKIILGSGLSHYFREKWKEFAKENNYRLYDIKADGALIIDL